MIPLKTWPSKLPGSLSTSSYHNQHYTLYIFILILPRIKHLGLRIKTSAKYICLSICTWLKFKLKILCNSTGMQCRLLSYYFPESFWKDYNPKVSCWKGSSFFKLPLVETYSFFVMYDYKLFLLLLNVYHNLWLSLISDYPRSSHMPTSLLLRYLLLIFSKQTLSFVSHLENNKYKNSSNKLFLILWSFLPCSWKFWLLCARRLHQNHTVRNRYSV